MTPKEIQLAGLDALLQNLGVVGMIRFLQYNDKGHGDYTKERHKWLGKPSFDDITNDIEKIKG
jgi:hypothetical protein